MRGSAWLLIVLFLALTTFAAFMGYSYGDYQGQDDGYREGYDDGVAAGAGIGYDVRNPTYNEMQDFLRRDKTNQNDYVLGEYICIDFVTDLNNNAEAQGFRAAYVHIEYAGESGHAVAGFETVDQGFIFIEPQYDEEVNVAVGISYSDENGYKEPNYNDTIARFVIIW